MVSLLPPPEPFLFKRYVLHQVAEYHQRRQASYASSVQREQPQGRLGIPWIRLHNGSQVFFSEDVSFSSCVVVPLEDSVVSQV
jgi:hypothetical protein